VSFIENKPQDVRTGIKSTNIKADIRIWRQAAKFMLLS